MANYRPERTIDRRLANGLWSPRRPENQALTGSHPGWHPANGAPRPRNTNGRRP